MVGMELLLFVPAYRDNYIESARRLQCKLPGVRVVFDLEDGCPLNDRPLGRANIERYGFPTDLYRVSREEVVLDLESIPGDATILVPKAEPDWFLIEHNTIAIIESARGLEYVREVAARSVGLIVGLGDLSTDLGSDGFHEWARRRVLVAGRAAGIPVYDSPSGTLEAATVVNHARDSYLLGFDGMVVLHPHEAQLTYDYAAPSPEEFKRCRSLVTYSADGGEAVHLNDRQVVGPPHVKRAKATLERWANHPNARGLGDG